MPEQSEHHHFKTGEALPPLKPGVLRLYSMAFCPFAERTRFVLAAKGIDYELVNVNTFQKPEWYFDKNPDGVVPTLEQDDKLIQESIVTCEYLDELYPDIAPMFPSDPYLRSRDKLFIQRFGKFISGFYLSGKEKGENEELRSAAIKNVESVEQELKKRGTPFFSGSSPGMVDFSIWPFIYRIPYSRSLGDGGLDSFVLLKQWMDRMRQDKIIAPRIVEDEALLEFSTHYRTPGSRFDEIQTKAIK
ncbi:glutathione S-transferase omega-1 [Strongylocentrotus purpuratus]|uniref:Glutathione S-transferase omega n=1 Tax=Strongylocentrotus purpuratus TaxID=7668 RepID=A0A7M7RDV1_STRPU|nr:glutathione S-transferase omega-1 [Strongylocentrotus purpuratus]